MDGTPEGASGLHRTRSIDVIPLVEGIAARIRRQKLLVAATEWGTRGSSVVLLSVVASFVNRPLALGAAAVGTLLVVWDAVSRNRRGGTPLPVHPTDEASTILDSYIGGKDRVLSLVRLRQEGGEEARVSLLVRQVAPLVAGLSATQVAPFTPPTQFRRRLATLATLWILTTLLLLDGRRSTVGDRAGGIRADATPLKQLLDEYPELPESVREPLRQLHRAVETSPLDAPATQDALEVADRAIEEASRSREGTLPNTRPPLPPTPIGASPTSVPASTPPPPPPSTPSTSNEAKEGGDKADDTSDGAQRDEKRESGGTNESTKQGGKAGSSEKASSSEEGEQGAANGGKGGSGEGTEGSQPGGTGSGSGSGQPQEEGKGAGGGTGGGTKEGSGGTSEGLAKARALVDELQEKRGAKDGAGGKEGQDGGAANAPSEAKGSGSKDRDEASPGGPKEGGRSERGAQGTGQRGEARTGAPQPPRGEPNRTNAKEGADGKENRESGNQKQKSEGGLGGSRTERGPIAPQPGAPRYEEGEGNGPGGLAGKQFRESAIRGADEKFDPRYTGKTVETAEHRGESRPRTKIEEVTLAKPEPIRQRDEQLIPLEYRDILR